MPSYDGKLITVKDLTLRIWGVKVTITGTIEILNIRRSISP